MADPGQRLIAAHRRAQIALRASMLQELIATWPLLDPRRLEATAPGWLQLASGLVVDYRGRSAAEGAAFYRAMRTVRTGELTAPPTPVLAWANEDDATATSLRVLGPVAVKHRTGTGEGPEQAARAAFVSVAGAAGRHVLTGARTAVDAAVAVDDRAVGFARYASGTACAFCKMLASRGAVYLSRSTAARTTGRGSRRGQQRYHDGCACLPVPLFSRDDPLPPGTDEYERLWVEASAGRSSEEAAAEFRRRVDAASAPSERLPAAATGQGPSDPPGGPPGGAATPADDLPDGRVPQDWLEHSLDDATPAELEALRTYTTPAYREINRALRGDIPMTEETRAVVELIDSALRRSLLPGWSRGLRVTGPDGLGVATASEVSRVVGATFTQGSFLSLTVADQPPPLRIADPILLDVLIPPGVAAVYVEPITAFPDQQELLVRRDLVLVVHSARYDEQLKVWRAVLIGAEVTP